MRGSWSEGGVFRLSGIWGFGYRQELGNIFLQEEQHLTCFNDASEAFASEHAEMKIPSAAFSSW